MYASNEDEFNHDDGEWVFLRQTGTPETKILNETINLADFEQAIISSTSTSKDCSVKSDRSDSITSISSTEDDDLAYNGNCIRHENSIITENPVINAETNNDTLMSTSEIKDEHLSFEIAIKNHYENETTPVINEYDSVNCENDNTLNQSFSSSDNFNAHPGDHAIENGESHLLEDENESQSLVIHTYRYPKRNRSLIIYSFIILLLIIELILSQAILSQRYEINQMKEKLEKTNQQIDTIKSISIDNIEKHLTKKIDEKYQKLLHQKQVEYDYEKYSFMSQTKALDRTISYLQKNVTENLNQLFNDNRQLNKYIDQLEHRLKIAEGQYSKENIPHSRNVDESKPLVDILFNKIMNSSPSISEDSSINLSSIFEKLSGTVTELVDRRHEYIEESKRQLNKIANSETVEHIRAKLRRSTENLSSSTRQTQSVYPDWAQSRAQCREQARMDNEKQDEKTTRYPWRWTFQRSHDREQLRQQIPITRKHRPNKEHVCYSTYEFPVKQLCTIQNWLEQFFDA